MKKICLFCKEEKEHYAKGLCKNCYQRKWARGTCEYYEHPTTSWYERNKEKVKENKKKYRAENKDKINNYNNHYYRKNKNKISNYKKQWYLKNRERILEKNHNNKVKNETE